MGCTAPGWPAAGSSSSRGKGWVRSRQAKHRQLLELEQAVFDPRASRIIIANSRMVARRDHRLLRRFRPEKIRVIYNGIAPRASWPESPPQSGARPARPSAWAGERLGGSLRRLRLGAQGPALCHRGNRANARRSSCWWQARANGAACPRSAKTRFLGESRDMESLMEAADAFLLPTLYDPFSNASLEALAAGLPVITTQANGFSEIMRPGRDGEVLATPREGIAEALQKWRELDTPELRDDRRAMGGSVHDGAKRPRDPGRNPVVTRPSRSAALKRRQRFRLVLVQPEHLVEPRDFQHRPHTGPDPDQPELPAVVGDPLHGVDQHRQPGAVDVAHLPQIHKDPRQFPLDERPQVLPHIRGFVEIDLSLEGDDIGSADSQMQMLRRFGLGMSVICVTPAAVWMYAADAFGFRLSGPR